MSYLKIMVCTSLLLLATTVIYAAKHPVVSAATVDLNRYAGLWYEIASIPDSAQHNCRCTTVNYVHDSGDTYQITGSCIKRKSGLRKSIVGTTWPITASNSQLRVRPNDWLISGEYWILYVDPDYQTALVGIPSRRFLWIIARQPSILDDQYAAIVQMAKDQGFKVKQLRKTKQDDCTY